MTTWKDLAEDSRLAVHEMFDHRRWRTCLSRAYFAVYSEATAELVLRGVVMPLRRSGPSHTKLPELVGNNLTGISHSMRWRLAGIIKKLYELRIVADYIPSTPVDAREARLSLGLMNQAFRFLRGVS